MGRNAGSTPFQITSQIRSQVIKICEPLGLTCSQQQDKQQDKQGVASDDSGPSPLVISSEGRLATLIQWTSSLVCIQKSIVLNTVAGQPPNHFFLFFTFLPMMRESLDSPFISWVWFTGFNLGNLKTVIFSSLFGLWRYDRMAEWWGRQWQLDIWNQT